MYSHKTRPEADGIRTRPPAGAQQPRTRGRTFRAPMYPVHSVWSGYADHENTIAGGTLQVSAMPVRISRLLKVSTPEPGLYAHLLTRNR